MLGKITNRKNLTGESSENAAIFARYGWISEVVQESVVHKNTSDRNFSEKLDRYLTHKVFGLVFLAAILVIIFQTIFTWASIPMDLLDSGFGSLADSVRANLPPGILTDLLSDGIIAGVGGVLVFLPQIFTAVFLHFDSRRYGLYGARRIFAGSPDARSRASR